MMPDSETPTGSCASVIAASASTSRLVFHFDMFSHDSDHFHPWLESQGQSPFTWTVLGALAERTERIELITGVTCPTMRYHPAVVALDHFKPPDRHVKLFGAIDIRCAQINATQS